MSSSIPPHIITEKLLHNFFLSLLLLIRCILSLSQAFLNNTELKIFGCHRESNTKRSATAAGCSTSVAERLCVIQAVLGSIPSGDQIYFFNSVLFLKACERVRIYSYLSSSLVMDLTQVKKWQRHIANMHTYFFTLGVPMLLPDIHTH